MNSSLELEHAKAAIQQGDKSSARSILRKVLEQEPRNVDAWLLFADAAQKPEHTIQCLERVQMLDPGNEIAVLRLEQIRQAPPEETQMAQESVSVLPENNPTYPANPQPLKPVQPLRYSDIAPRPAAKPKTPLSKLEKWLIAILGVLCFCVLGVLGFTLLSGSLLGFASNKPSPTPTDYSAIIYENIRASNAEDKQAYMSTLHPDSPAYKPTEEMLDTIFQNYDLSYQVSNLSIIEESKQEVKLTYILVTRKIRGGDFRDNQVDGIITLRKDGDIWKIFNQTVDNVKYLN